MQGSGRPIVSYHQCGKKSNIMILGRLDIESGIEFEKANSLKFVGAMIVNLNRVHLNLFSL
jgi:hypothetical protein